MSKLSDEHKDAKELETLREHLHRQDKVLQTQGNKLERMEKTLDEMLILLSGSVIGKTKGLVQIVEDLSDSLETWSSKFMHAEKWRERFVAGEKERREMQAKKQQTDDDRVYQEHLKDKEIQALKKSNVVKNWVTGISVAVTIAKLLFDYFK